MSSFCNELPSPTIANIKAYVLKQDDKVNNANYFCWKSFDWSGVLGGQGGPGGPSGPGGQPALMICLQKIYGLHFLNHQIVEKS